MQNIKGGRWNTLAKKQAKAVNKVASVTVKGDPLEIGRVLLTYEIVMQLKELGMLSIKKESAYIGLLAKIINNYQVRPNDVSGTYTLRCKY